MEISPIAQVALLQTEINSGFRLSPRMGMNSAGGKEDRPLKIEFHHCQRHHKPPKATTDIRFIFLKSFLS